MSWPRLSESTKERLAGLMTLIIALPAMVLLGQMAWKFVHAVWTDHWIRKDAQPVAAIVTHLGPKRMLEYRYAFNGRDYSGRDLRDWEDERNHPLNVGDPIPARASASHPWLSALGIPHGHGWVCRYSSPSRCLN